MEVPPNNSDDENNPNKKLGNFKIKLKIPKQQHHQNPAQIQDDDELEEGEIREDQDQEEGEITPADNTNNNNNVIKREISSPNQDQGVIIQAAVGGLRVCLVCRKGFGSGKALGGHMRVHAEPSPNHLKKLKIVPGRVSSNPSPSLSPSHHQQVFKCDHCPKEFRSQKSLFGHMRSHPERQWRGMNPPPDLTTGSGPSSPSPGSTPCPDPYPSRSEIKTDWTVKRKRGQSCSSSSSSDGGGQQVAAEVAATDLMLILAGGERNSRVKEKGKGKIKGGANLEYDSDEVYYLKNMGYLDSDYCDTDEDEEVVKEKAAIGVELEGDDKVMMGEKRSGKRRRMKGKRIRVLGSNQKLDDQIQGEVATSSGKNININTDKNNDGKWRCNTCSKTFSTHQALGGHRSSHNKEKNLGIQISHHTHAHTHIHIDTRAHVDMVEGSGLTSPGLVGGDKTFPSDQSDDLEGQHYPPPCEPSSSSPGQSSCQTGRRDNVIEFDLNEAPTTMVEDEEEAEGDVQSHLKFFS